MIKLSLIEEIKKDLIKHQKDNELDKVPELKRNLTFVKRQTMKAIKETQKDDIGGAQDPKTSKTVNRVRNRELAIYK